jgi:micrococcal nuclease
VRVVDGDTIKVRINGQTYTVRYVGMDTPETVAPNRPVEYMGPEASAKNKALVSGRQVILVKDISETDKYGRLLRFVLVDGLFVNRELLRLGYAQTITYPPDISCKDAFRAVEKQAREQQVGLWAPGEHFAPCDCNGPDLDCSDFDTQVEAQLCFDYCGGPAEDPFHLHRGNGPRVCTSLP